VCYCGAKENLSVSHILRNVVVVQILADNTILICKSCNSKKGGKRLYEYFKHDKRDKFLGLLKENI
jgi:5-methylcytosine-specific restriction endonuclease McrA